jgi:hypothetical protein
MSKSKQEPLKVNFLPFWGGVRPQGLISTYRSTFIVTNMVQWLKWRHKDLMILMS